MLRIHDGKLVVTADGKLAICAGGAIVIAIINTNSLMDDNFRVTLNGTVLGEIDNSGNGCTGRLFSTQDGIANYTGMPACFFGAYNLQPTLVFNRNLLIAGQNTLTITVIQVNGSGNFGALQIVILNETNTAIQKTLLNSSYPIGFQAPPWSYTFDYP